MMTSYMRGCIQTYRLGTHLVTFHYPCMEVNKMNDKLLTTLFIGIDVSLENNHVTSMDFHENIYCSKNFKNNIPGSDELVNSILSIRKKFNFTHIVIGIESTSIYSTHVATYLAAEVSLKSFETKVHILNPKTTKNYRKTFSNLQKTDPTDSYLIADFARTGKIKTHPWNGDQHISLKRLTRHRLHIVELISAEKTYYQSNLFLKFSEFARLKGKTKLFSDKFGSTATSIIEEFLTLDEIAYISVEELAEFILEKSKNHFIEPNKIAAKIQKAARDSYRLDKLAYDPITIALASSLNLIRTYQNELKIIDKAIVQTVKGYQKRAIISLKSIGGIGPVFAAGIIAEIGDIRCFKNDNALAQYSGITWSRNDSGGFKSEDTKLTKTGNKYLRYYLIEAANSVRKSEPEYHDYYISKFKEATKHHHRRAVTLTSRKLIRLIYCLLDNNSQYDPNYNRK